MNLEPADLWEGAGDKGGNRPNIMLSKYGSNTSTEMEIGKAKIGFFSPLTKAVEKDLVKTNMSYLICYECASHTLLLVCSTNVNTGPPMIDMARLSLLILKECQTDRFFIGWRKQTVREMPIIFT